MMNAYESTMNFTRRAVWAQIDLDAAAHNMRQIRKHVGPDVKIAAVVKANAYGHGSVELAKTFAENGADCFAVSSLDKPSSSAAMRISTTKSSSSGIPTPGGQKNS